MLESGNMSHDYDEGIPLATVSKLPDVDDPQFQEFIKNDALIVRITTNYIDCTNKLIRTESLK